jgi:hypothetical protein
VATVTEGDGNGDLGVAQYAVLSNGDALFMFLHDDRVTTSLFHADTGSFDPRVSVVGQQPFVYQDSFNRQLVAADSMDRLTIAWFAVVGDVTDAGDNRVGHAFASRSFDRGAHWSTPADLGRSSAVTLAIGPAGQVVAAMRGDGLGGGVMGSQGNGGPNGISLRTISATGTSWSAPVSTKVQTGSAPYAALSYTQRILFDASGQVILVGVQLGTDDAGQSTNTLQTVTCSL